MRLAVIITGVLAAIATMFPGLVIVGYFLLVVPGVVLSLAPTVFPYLLATWLVGAMLPVRQVWLARGAALVLVVALASVAVLPWRLSALAEFDQAQVPDVAAEAPIALAGDVRIERRGLGLAWDEPPPCDALCKTILGLAEVTSVTVQRDDMAATYRLGMPEDGGEDGGEPGPVPTAGVRQADFILRDIIENPGESPFVSCAEIVQGSDLLLRHCHVQSEIPVIPPLLVMDFGDAGMGFPFNGLKLLSTTREAGDVMQPGGQDEVLERALLLPG